MAPSTVSKRLKHLETMGNCDIQSDTHCSVVTVARWDLYQNENRKVTSKGTTKEQPSDRQSSGGIDNSHAAPPKNEKNVKNNRVSAKEPADPNVKAFLIEWQGEWEKRFGSPYTFDWGKDGKLIKGLLKVYSIEALRELRDRFFESRDPFIQKSGYTVGVFKSQVNKLITAEKTKGKERLPNGQVTELKEF
jgi:hypothetical protein